MTPIERRTDRHLETRDASLRFCHGVNADEGAGFVADPAGPDSSQTFH